jgi:hypothetical protein
MQALSFAVHIPLVCFGIAFPAMVLFIEWMYLRSGDELYRVLARRWSKVLVALFAAGLLARSAGAGLVAGFGLLTVADATWAHGIGVVCLLAFIVLGFGAMRPTELAASGGTTGPWLVWLGPVRLGYAEEAAEMAIRVGGTVGPGGPQGVLRPLHR